VSAPFCARSRPRSACGSESDETGLSVYQASVPDTSQMPAESAATGHASTTTGKSLAICILPLLLGVLRGPHELVGAGLRYSDPFGEHCQGQFLVVPDAHGHPAAQ
jgi:hypothetical protein